jgi:hypothetical protein
MSMPKNLMIALMRELSDDDSMQPVRNEDFVTVPASPERPLPSWALCNRHAIAMRRFMPDGSTQERTTENPEAAAMWMLRRV